MPLGGKAFTVRCLGLQLEEALRTKDPRPKKLLQERRTGYPRGDVFLGVLYGSASFLSG
jgi:hypothetical protein